LSLLVVDPFRFGVPFASLYQAFDPLTVLTKQHFIEWFSGKDIDSIFTKRTIVSGGTFAMVDAINEGFSVKTNAVTNAEISLDFNDIRHYSETDFFFHCVWRVAEVPSSTEDVLVGLANVAAGSASNHVEARTLNNQTNFMTLSGDNVAGQTQTSTTVAKDTVFHGHTLDMGSSAVKHSIDGVLKVTKTDKLPGARLQPRVRIFTGETVTKDVRLRYLEVFTT